jgi:glutathione S-transferase
MTLRLYGMSFSPYSEKARWALDHHRVPYAWGEHVPMVGELPLRMRAGRLRGKVSVPLAVDGDTVLRDSLAIAKHADRVGAGSPLFPDHGAVDAWNERSDAALGAGRVLFVARSVEDREALRESLPGWVPGPLRGAMTPLAASATRFIARKYGADAVAQAEAMATMREALGALRAALSGRSSVLEGFSYADIAMAVVLQMVSPVDSAYVPLGPARRRAWTEPTLAKDYADLVEWRDGLYASRRR